MNRSVLIVAEGEHELSTGEPDAALPTLVQRLAGDEIRLVTTSRRIRECSRHMHPGRGDRLGRKLLGIVQMSDREGFSAAGVLIDQDDDISRHQSATFAQESNTTNHPRAVGIAVRSFDAWFLADHAALSIVSGTRIDMQPDPEQHSDPKSACRKFAQTANEPKPLRFFYAHLARLIDLDVARKRCPKGFATFSERVASRW